MVRHRTVTLGASFLCVGVVLGLFVNEHSPERVNAQLEAPGRAGEPDRDQLYAQLDREAAEFERYGRLLRSVVRLSAPFVVHIEAKKPSGRAQANGRERFVEEAGSGIIIEHRSRFYVLTNRHVIKDAARERITIQLNDSRDVRPTAVVADPDTDIAVMSVNATDLVSARLGDSESVEIGDFVLAVGSPFGLSRSVTHGIVSAKGRRDLELGGDDVRYQDFIQTDAAINPGNSGGPLLNMRGAVIGMNTAIASSSGGNEGIGFSIPINMAMIIARQLIENGSVRRAFLGVNLDSKFDVDMARQLGLPQLQGADHGSDAKFPGRRGGAASRRCCLGIRRRAGGRRHSPRECRKPDPGEQVRARGRLAQSGTGPLGRAGWRSPAF